VSRCRLGQDFFTVSGLSHIVEFCAIPAMSDKRAKQRQRVLKPAKIGFNRGSVIDCTIRDISEDGACLRVASALGIPEFFELILDDKTTRPCRIMWRKETQIGVRFQSKNDSATDTQKDSIAIWRNNKNTSLPVLIVDDSLTMALIISDLVRKVGFTEVDIAHDGHSALDQLRHRQYGLVLSDWEMQPMSGEEFLNEMRQDKMIGKIPIIMVTGTAGRGASRLAGASAYLHKPFSESDLKTAIKRVLEPSSN
jgi:two-component system chemotaxis response regulator CheY